MERSKHWSIAREAEMPLDKLFERKVFTTRDWEELVERELDNRFKRTMMDLELLTLEDLQELLWS